ncbi:MAG: ABC transporter permease [Acidobacteriaceae bacterium]|jgi:predicted permease
MRALLRRLRYLLYHRRFDAELQSDMEFHREMAARAGRSNFGNTTRMREQAYEAWGWTWLDRLGHDLRFASRTLRRAPGFTLVAVLVLAVGIGVNVSAFSLFDMIALRPLPVRDPNSIVRLERRSPDSYNSEMSFPSFAFYRDHAKSLSAAIAVLGVPPMQIDNDVQPTSASFVTANYFSELGTPAAAGRLFDPVLENTPAAPPSVVLSFSLWQRRFGGNPSIIGQVIRLNRKPAVVLGVTPYALASLGGQHPDLWMPMPQQPYFIEGSHVLTSFTSSGVRMWGRLAPGVSIPAATDELRALTTQLRSQHPEAVENAEYLQVSPGGHSQTMLPEILRVAAMVAVLTLLILIVACANLGGLLLARAVTREHEIGIRIAIGASRLRLFRQLLTESLLLSVLGAVAGLATGCAVVRIVLTQLEDAPKWFSAAPDWRVLLFTAATTLLAACFFGLAPALQIARQRQHKTLVRKILVAAQVAACCVLLIVAGLLVRATHHALFTDPGFGYQQLISIDPQLDHHGYTPAAAAAYLDQMQDRLSAQPGVQSVSLARMPPLGHIVSRYDEQVNGRTVNVYPNWVAPGFFQTMGIPLLAGRTFYPHEQNALIVNESFARRMWPHGSALGQRANDNQTVVGVVGDAHINALNDDDAAEAYWSASQNDLPSMVLIVRAAGDPARLPAMAKSISESLDPKIFPEIRRLAVLYHDFLQPLEQIALVVTLIGFVAVALAGIGLIGLVTFTVSQRLREIAIRVALGARPAQIVTAVLQYFWWPTLAGLCAGTVFAAAASKVLRVALFGISNLDPASYAAALLTLALILGLSMLLPARCALHPDLAEILHHD